MTSLPVLTAVGGADWGATWESRLVAALDRGDLGVTVVRRCVDLADLLATASTGQARAAILSADLRRLDREALTRLAVAGVAVVGLVAPGDEQAERRLRQLGLVTVLPADVSPQALTAAVADAVLALTPAPSDPRWLAEPRVALPDGVVPDGVVPPDAGGALPGTGRVVAVWGPTGAPGRTTLAVGLAAELAALGWPTLLADADVYGGVVAQVLSLLDEAPGLAAACRLANNGQLDVAALLGLARQLTPSLRVLTGIARADRWPELRPGALESVLALSTTVAAVTVVDTGFCLEQDEELSYDTMAPRRNGATLAVLERADVVVAVGTADPVGLQRLVRGLTDLRELGIAPTVVVNRLRPSGVPGDAEREVRAALQRYAGVEHVWCVPLDTAGVDAAVSNGRTLVEQSPGSPARQAICALAASLVGAPAPRRKRLLLRR